MLQFVVNTLQRVDSTWLYFFTCLEQQIMILKLLTLLYFLKDWNGMKHSRREAFLGKEWGTK